MITKASLQRLKEAVTMIMVRIFIAIFYFEFNLQCIIINNYSSCDTYIGSDKMLHGKKMRGLDVLTTTSMNPDEANNGK